MNTVDELLYYCNEIEPVGALNGGAEKHILSITS